MQLTMPDGIDFKVWNSLADAYRGRMALLLRNGLLGLTLVFILLSLFLERFKTKNDPQKDPKKTHK